jgi:adenylate cyclase
MPKLSYRDVRGVLREQQLEGRTTVGRHPEQTIQLLDRVVSKEHAIFERVAEGGWGVRDGGSRNGTLVNGELIQGVYRLKDGDRVTVGSTDMVYQEEARTEPSKTTRVTIQAEGMETHIRSRLAPLVEERFLPEAEMRDVGSLRRDYEKLRVSHELNQSIGLEMDLEVLLQKVLDKAFEIFPADRGVILLQQGKEGKVETLQPMIIKSKSGDADLENVKISRTILTEILEEKQAVLSSDAMMDSRFSKSHSIVLEQIRSTMSVPLLHDKTVLGVIHLDSKIARGAFTEKDLQILSGFARQAAMMIEHQRLLRRMREEILAREHLNRLLSPQLVEEVMSGRLQLQRGGELRAATVVFADIRGFTTMSEQMTPQEVVALLNEYFELMVDVIFKHNGMLDKFVGDELMAVWGAPLSRADDTIRAVLAAIEMQAVVRDLNNERARQGLKTIQIGIGLNSGEVVAGYMGSTKSMNYTVMGDTVNTAARFCSAAGPTEILIGERTWAQVHDRVRAEILPPTKLKGKLEHVDIYRVLGLLEAEDEGSMEPQTPPDAL